MTRKFMADTDYLVEGLCAGMSHLNHHLNTAWNSRNAHDEQRSDCADAVFNRRRKFPREAELELDIEI